MRAGPAHEIGKSISPYDNYRQYGRDDWFED
jgi:hypothetical protein